MLKKTYTLLLSSSKGLSVLKSAIFCGISIRKVAVAKDIKVNNDYSSDIIDLCLKHSLNYTLDYKNLIFSDKDIIVAVSWKHIINHPMNKLLIFHDSLLPSYRGFAPLINMLIHNEKTIGVTALLGDKEYDRGKILMQKSIDITYPIKINQAISIISNLYAELSKKIFQSNFDAMIESAYNQDEQKASYSIWVDENDYLIDWSKSSEEIQRFVDAVGFPYKGALTYLNQKEVIIDEVTVVNDVKIVNRDYGKIIFIENSIPIVICGSGLLKIEKGRIKNDKNYENLIPLKNFRSKFIGKL